MTINKYDTFDNLNIELPSGFETVTLDNLSEDEVAAIKQCAADEGITVGDLIRRITKSEVAEHQRFFPGPGIQKVLIDFPFFKKAREALGRLIPIAAVAAFGLMDTTGDGIPDDISTRYPQLELAACST